MADFTRIDNAIQNSSFGSEGARALSGRPEAGSLAEPEVVDSAAIIDMWTMVNAAVVMTTIADVRATAELKELVGLLVQRLRDAWPVQYEGRDLDSLRDGALAILEQKLSKNGQMGVVSAFVYESIFEYQAKMAQHEGRRADSPAGPARFAIADHVCLLMRQLDHDLCEVLVLRYGFGLRLPEVAAIMRLGEGVVRSMTHNGFEQLQKRIAAGEAQMAASRLKAIEEATERADQGSSGASEELAKLLVTQDDLATLARRAWKGDECADKALRDELLRRSKMGDSIARHQLDAWLANKGELTASAQRVQSYSAGRLESDVGWPGTPEHDHCILLIAGGRPEVARLAPVAMAFNEVDRIRALTVATGPDPMAVHEAFEALGVPADVTQLVRDKFDPVNPASVGAMLMTRLDELLVDLDPSAIMIYGGGMTAVVAAQVAFWRQIPIVHLQAGVASDDLLCPFPQEANRRIIGQLASLFLTTDAAALGSPIGPNAIPVGDTMAANPQPADLRFTRLVRRVRVDGPRIVLVALDQLDSLGVLAGLPELLEAEPEVEVVLFGELGTHGAAAPIASHPRGTVVRNVPLSDLFALLRVSAVLVSDNPELVSDAPGFGTPAVLVDGHSVAEPGDSIRSILSPRVTSAVRQLLVAPQPVPGQSDGLEAVRVEQAVAWMFGMTPSPQLDSPQLRTDDSTSELRRDAGDAWVDRGRYD